MKSSVIKYLSIIVFWAFFSSLKILVIQHYIFWIWLDFDLHMVALCKITQLQDQDEADWLDPFINEEKKVSQIFLCGLTVRFVVTLSQQSFFLFIMNNKLANNLEIKAELFLFTQGKKQDRFKGWIPEHQLKVSLQIIPLSVFSKQFCVFNLKKKYFVEGSTQGVLITMLYNVWGVILISG